jgi:hypothetical protein
MIPNTLTASSPIFNPPSQPLSYQECLTFFQQYLQSFPCFTPADLINLQRYWEYSTIRKNKKIINSKQVCQEMKFICTGKAKYYTEDLNKKYLLAFLPGCNFCTHMESFYYQTVTENAAVSCTDTYGLKITHANYQRLIRERPAFDVFFKKMIFSEIAFLKKRVQELLSLDAKERCRLLENEIPTVFEDFKLIDISNYLGIKPETLVRLRKTTKGNNTLQTAR